MGELSLLSNNIELILQHSEQIKTYAPYTFSRLIIKNPRRLGGQWYEQNMFMGAYVEVWHQYLQKSPEPAILPLYIGSGMFGTIYKFLGLSLADKVLVKKVPVGKMHTSYMRNPMWAFIQTNPIKGLGIPLSQVVEEIKAGKPVEERESYRLLNLREDFYRSVGAISGIRSEGEHDLAYSLEQGVNYQLMIQVHAIILLELSDREKKELVFGGSAVELNDMVTETRKDLAALAMEAGFTHHNVMDSRTNWAKVRFTRQISSIDEVLEGNTISSMCGMLYAMRKRIRRL
ncbi:hypothetical protein [Rufibacter aurantiacus]|uniref:hypothetical protein n=1 Tax=Rufibacter aurantiacus TaxID=2817374 RepID=UPI001B30A256|nr:hypothetical protein [Rufibacter aurantiacus]